MKQIFISHCEADEPIVKPLVEMIHWACDLSRDDIFCTCIKGMGCSAGDIFSEAILNAFNESSIIVAFLTKNYKESEFCMAELGASWVSKRSKVFIPLIDSDIDYNFFKGVLTGVHELKINDEYGLSQLCDKICDKLGKSKNVEAIRAKVNDFLEVYGEKKVLCPSPFSCTKEQWDNLEEEKNFYKRSFEELGKEIDSKNEYIESLKKLKDHSEVSDLDRNFNKTDIDKFQEAVKEVRSQRSNFDRGVFKFVIYNLLDLGDPTLETEEYNSLEQAVKSKILYKNGSEEYCVDSGNRHVKALMSALELFQAACREASKDTRSLISDKYDVDFDISNAEFDDKILSL